MSNISVGDLVMVVKPTNCCKNISAIGRLFVVEEIAIFDSYCTHCKKEFGITIKASKGNKVYSLDRLKKIPPIFELEDKEIKEEMPC